MTYVQITYDLRHDPIKAGAIGYVDGYVRGGDDSPCAVVVIEGAFYLVAIHGLRVCDPPTQDAKRAVEAGIDAAKAFDGPRIDRLAEALRLVLPLAKGYATKNKVGSNAEYVANAEMVLAAADAESTP